MAKIDWSYHRPGCKTCGKTQAFLASAGHETKEQIDARKQALKEKEALELAKSVQQVYVAKGKKVVHVDLRKDELDGAALARLLLGPTGNLRAPTLRVGKTLLVGFDEETYRRVLGPGKKG